MMTAGNRFKEIKQEKQIQKEDVIFESQLRKKRLDSRFNENQYLFVSNFKFFGGKYKIYNNNKELLFNVVQKAFKLRGDIRVYTDTALKNEILKITTKKIIDVWVTYEIYDSSKNEIVGFLRCRSLIEGHWIFLSPEKTEIARLTEKTGFAASTSFVFPFVGRLLPRKYNIYNITNNVDNTKQEIAEIKQKFNPFLARYILKIEKSDIIDPRLLIAIGILLMAFVFPRK